jgi:succinyl-diaminopimelate desuccinylase
LTQLLYALQSEPLDGGSERFDPSTLEIVSVDVGNPAWNVIPALPSHD